MDPKFLVCCIFLLCEISSILAGVNFIWETPFDADNHCADRIPRFVSCKQRLQSAIQSSTYLCYQPCEQLGIARRIRDSTIDLTHAPGQLVSWEHMNRTQFVKFCEITPQLEECFNYGRPTKGYAALVIMRPASS